MDERMLVLRSMVGLGGRVGARFVATILIGAA
jgi:hypothetical protein